MSIIRVFLSALLCSVVIFLSACSTYSQGKDAFAAGDTITPERLDELSRNISDTTDDVSEKAETVEVKFSYSGKCYWVKGSEVFHTSSDCRYIKNSDNVNSGEPYSAASDGCERMCSACLKKLESNTTTENN